MVILRHRGTAIRARLLLALALGLALSVAYSQKEGQADQPVSSAASAANGTSAPAPANRISDAAPAASRANPAPTAVAPTTPIASASAAGDTAASRADAASLGEASGPAETVTEIKPEVFYSRDQKDGHLVPLIGFSYEDFIKYYRLQEHLDTPAGPPQYSIQQMTLIGVSRGDRAELTVVFKLLLNSAGWVRVPLALNKCVLRGSAEFKGTGEEFLQPDAASGGYICWIRAAANSPCELTLNVLAPVSSSAEENRLELSLPHAAVSKLTLHVPTMGVVASASPGIAPPDVSPASPPSSGSDISALGIGGDCWLAWRESDQPAAQLSSALEATGAILVRIDGRSVNSDATLSVRSFGAEFDHFHVRLPPGAELVGGRQDGYTLTAGSGKSSGQVEVKLDRKTVGPVEVRLLTERTYDATTGKDGAATNPERLELAGFDVVEAIPHRQWGYLAVAVAGDWQLIWGEQNRMRQVSELPDNLRRKDIVAGFEYFGQPNSLVVRVMPRKTRSSVEPQYVYSVHEDEVRLDARLDYTIRGAKLFKFEIDMAGWEFDRVRPEGLIDVGSISTSPGGLLTLPLIEPATGEIELAITAHRRNKPKTKTIAWSLPRPRADVIGPAEIAISPAENIELTPRVAELKGLARSTGEGINLRPVAGILSATSASSIGSGSSFGAAPAIEGLPATTSSNATAPAATTSRAPSNDSQPVASDLPSSPGGVNSIPIAPFPPPAAPSNVSAGIELSPVTLFYLAEQPDANFAADIVVRPQDIAVETDDQVSIRDRDISVSQAIDYTVRYVPLEHLRLEVGRELLEQHKLKFALGTEALEPQVVPSQTAPDRTTVELVLPRPLLGAVRLDVSYIIPSPRTSATKAVPLDLPLALPRDGTIADNSATVSAASGILVEQRESPWSVVDAGATQSGADQPLRLTATDPVESLRLAILRDDSRAQGTTFVDRAWIQSWVTESQRQDRVEYRFTTGEDQLRLDLPTGVAASDVEATLDGQLLSPQTGQSNQFVITVPQDSVRREHLLELRYQFANREPQNTSLALDAPQWGNHVNIRRTYWQVLLPTDEQVLGASSDLSAEFEWAWNSGFVGLHRVPLKNDGQLEDWIGTSDFAASAPAGALARLTPGNTSEHFNNVNRYLFSSAGQVGRASLFVVRRWVLLLLSSAIVLAIGLSLIYFPLLRRLRVVVAVLAIAMILAAIYPDPAILIAQAGCLGLLLIFAALVLQWLVNRPAAPIGSRSVTQSPRLDRSSTRIYPKREPVVEPATTASLPVVAEGSSRSHL